MYLVRSIEWSTYVVVGYAKTKKQSIKYIKSKGYHRKYVKQDNLYENEYSNDKDDIMDYVKVEEVEL